MIANLNNAQKNWRLFVRTDQWGREKLLWSILGDRLDDMRAGSPLPEACLGMPHVFPLRAGMCYYIITKPNLFTRLAGTARV